MVGCGASRNFISMQQMAMPSFAVTSPPSHGGTLSALHARHSQRLHKRRVHSQVRAVAQTQLQYQKLGDSDLFISEVTLGTVCMIMKLETLLLQIMLSSSQGKSFSFQMTFGEQNTEKEAHDIIAYSFDQGINILDTAEIVSTDSLLLLTIPLSVFKLSDGIYFSIFFLLA